MKAAFTGKYAQQPSAVSVGRRESHPPGLTAAVSINTDGPSVTAPVVYLSHGCTLDTFHRHNSSR